MIMRSGLSLLMVVAASAQLSGILQPADELPPSTVPLINALMAADTNQFERLMNQYQRHRMYPPQVNDIDVITPLYAAQEYTTNSKQRHQILKLLKWR